MAITVSSTPQLKLPTATFEAGGSADKVNDVGLMVALSPEPRDRVVSSIPFAIDPRVIFRGSECWKGFCARGELGGMIHPLEVPLIVSWLGAEGHAGAWGSYEHGPFGLHLRGELFGAADRATSWPGEATATTWSASGAFGATVRVKEYLFAAEAMISHSAGTRYQKTSDVTWTRGFHETVYLLGVTIGLDTTEAP